ncbi:MAG: hypothetical protein JJU29_22970, partial [Verrucomicrobia bacterium]|nr:hypothetical protein [Verrucomicrobiota bacterium]
GEAFFWGEDQRMALPSNGWGSVFLGGGPTDGFAVQRIKTCWIFKPADARTRPADLPVSSLVGGHKPTEILRFLRDLLFQKNRGLGRKHVKGLTVTPSLRSLRPPVQKIALDWI